MSNLAIHVEQLSKEYHIGRQTTYKTFRETLNDLALAPLRRARSVMRGQASIVESKPFWALRDVSFRVDQGEVVGIIGRNGAGKSTLLKILSRITEPTSGYAEIHGRVGTLLEVGTGFHPELTGRENVYLNGAILGMSRDEINRKFDEIVAFAEVEQFIDTMVKHYSSGMYLRLAFAVAAHLEPEILIVDEVLAVGDAQFQKKCLGKMGDVAKQGRTVLFVSHNMAAVRGLCHRVIWLSGGKIVADGMTSDIVNQYLLETTATDSRQIDVRDAPRSFHFGERLKITNITFNHGEPIYHGQPLHVHFDYEAYADVYGVAFGFGFASLEGTRILSVDSDLNAPQFDIPKDEHSSVDALVDELHLQPGIYMLDIGVRSGDNNALDYLPSYTQIEILPSEATSNIMIRQGNTGGVRYPATWTWGSVAIQEHQ